MNEIQPVSDIVINLSFVLNVALGIAMFYGLTSIIPEHKNERNILIAVSNFEKHLTAIVNRRFDFHNILLSCSVSEIFIKKAYVLYRQKIFEIIQHDTSFNNEFKNFVESNDKKREILIQLSHQSPLYVSVILTAQNNERTSFNIRFGEQKMW